MKRILRIAIFLICAASASGFCSTRIDLDKGWYFRVDPASQGEAGSWMQALPGDVQSVNVPHTWNVGRNAGYIGRAWYFRTFNLPAESLKKQVDLHFGATFYAARVWVNGVEVGHHEGGYTAYDFDITPYAAQHNFVAVEVDNTITASTIPGLALRGSDKNYDWWNYGGIVRDVWLTTGGNLQVKRQQIRSELAAGTATIRDRVYLRNRLKAPATISLLVTAYDPSGRAVASAKKRFKVAAGTADTRLSLAIVAPKLWSIDSPNVYRMVARIKSAGGKLLDEQSDTFGLRKIEIRDRHLLVNGERMRLTGITRHEESLAEGLAESPATMRTDYDDLKSLQVTLTRPVHYPQNQFILDYADRHGILLIPEIPVWQFSEAQLRDPKVIEGAKRQIREMIEEAGNHPSIFAWSVCNESATGTPAGIAFFRMMRDYIRTLDPGRYVSYADDNLPKLASAGQSAANDADFLMMNQYFGTWHGPENGLSAALDKIDHMFPGKMMIISEFGVPGFFAENSDAADKMRSRIIEEQLPELAKRDWVAGAILWCYQDYKSRRNLRPGLQEGFVDHGLVDENRQRKPSYYVWKDLNAPATLQVEWPSAGNTGVGFTVEITPNPPSELPSYPLHDYKLVWEIRNSEGAMVANGEQQIPDLSTQRTISQVFAMDAADGLRLHLSLLRPTGTIAAERAVLWNAAAKDSVRNQPAVPANPVTQ